MLLAGASKASAVSNERGAAKRRFIRYSLTARERILFSVYTPNSSGRMRVSNHLTYSQKDGLQQFGGRRSESGGSIQRAVSGDGKPGLSESCGRFAAVQGCFRCDEAFGR